MNTPQSTRWYCDIKPCNFYAQTLREWQHFRMATSSESKLGKSLRICLKVLHIGSKLGSHPFEIDKKTHRIIKTKSKRKLLFWGFMWIYSTVYETFQIVRFIQSMCCLDITYGRLFSNLLTVITFAAAFFSNLNSFICMDTLPEFVNQLTETKKILTGDHTVLNLFF